MLPLCETTLCPAVTEKGIPSGIPSESLAGISRVPSRQVMFNPRCVLLTIGTVQAVHACRARKVLELIESGTYLWVFDFAVENGGKRELRFWFDELADPKAVRAMNLAEVVDCILPPRRATYAPGEVLCRFVLSSQSLLRLRRAMGWPLGDLPRGPLAEFLRARWIGGGQ